MNHLSRRQLLGAVGGTFAISSLAGCTENGPDADGTTQTTETASRTTAAATTETTTEETTQAPEDVPPPESFRWRHSINGGISRSPVVDDETVYLFSGGIYALNTATGAVRWKHDVNRYIRQRPVLHDGTLYVVSGFTGCGVAEDYVCYALDATSGDSKWKLTPQRDEQPSANDEGQLGLLGVTTETVYVTEEYNDEWTTVYALNYDGDVRWRAKYDTISLWGETTENGLYLTNPHLHALESETGTVRWRADNKSYSDLTVVDSALYADHRSGLVAFDTDDGSVRWRATTRSRPERTHNGSVIYTVDRKRLLAFDDATGREKWRYDDDYYLDTPISDDRSIYVGSENGMVALNKTDGSLRWTFGRQPDGEHHTLDIGVGNAVYVRIGDEFYCLTAKDGEPLWRLGEDAVNEFTPVDGTIYAGDGYERAFAIDTPEVTTTSETAGKVAASDGVAYSDGRTAHAKPQSMIPALGSCFGGK